MRVWGVVERISYELRAMFFAYHPLFSGGVSVATGDLDGDGVAEVITGAGPGGGPHVRVWRIAGGTATEVFGFFAYSTLTSPAARSWPQATWTVTASTS